MMRSDIARVGGAAAIAFGIVFVIVTLNRAAMPTNSEEWVRFVAETPLSYYIDTLGFALVSILMIPVITAVSDELMHLNAGAVRWTSILGYIGCAGNIMEVFRYLQVDPYQARLFLEGDELIQTILIYSTVPDGRDMDGWMLYGAVGIWFLVIAIVALRHQRGEHPFSRAWGYLGVFAAIIHFVALASRAWPVLSAPAGILGGLIGAPIWGIVTWQNLRRVANQDQVSDHYRKAG